MEVSSQDKKPVVGLLRQAVHHHQSGRLTTARDLYSRFVEIEPDNSQGWYLLGCVCQQLQDSQKAEASLRRAISIDPNCEQYHHNLATILQTQHKTEDAIRAYETALEVNPTYSKAMHGLATAYHQNGKLEEALRCFNKVIGENPDHSGARFNKGILLFQQGKAFESIVLLQEILLKEPETPGIHLYLAKAYLEIENYQDAIQHFQAHLYLDPTSPTAMLGLGESYLHTGKFRQAVSCFEKIFMINDSFPEAHNNSAICFQALREPDRARSHYETAIQMAPQNPTYRNNLGTLLLKTCYLEEAILRFQEALEIRPHYPDALVNLGNAHMETKNLDLAGRCFEEVLKGNSSHVYALWHRGLLRLLQGDLLHGFQDYEVREKCTFLSLEKRILPAPRWNGKENTDSSLLVYCEQGFGDSIQFSRFVPHIQDMVGETYFECPPPLKRIFESMLPEENLISRGKELPEIDFTLPLHSLPHVLGTTLETIPAVVPYLHAPSPPLPDSIADVLANLDRENQQIIGIAWAGNPEQTNDFRRSGTLSSFLSLKEVEGLKLISLQVELRKGDEDLLRDNQIPSLGPLVKDFGDTAQILNSLDLFISVDTAAAHLSGALGLETWILLSYAADWRWMEDRSDSPWYPSARLFRQPRPGDWESVFKTLTKELKKWMRKKGRSYADSFSEDEITAAASKKTLEILRQFVEDS